MAYYGLLYLDVIVVIDLKVGINEVMVEVDSSGSDRIGQDEQEHHDMEVSAFQYAPLEKQGSETTPFIFVDRNHFPRRAILAEFLS